MPLLDMNLEEIIQNLQAENMKLQERVTDISKKVSKLDHRIPEPLDHIHWANSQCVASANLQLNQDYHERILKEALQSFYCAIVTAFLGFALFLAATIFFMLQNTQLAFILIHHQLRDGHKPLHGGSGGGQRGPSITGACSLSTD